MLALRPLSLPATALIVALGLWIAGGWISDDFRVSMALTAVVRLADGRRFATLTGLMTSPGPDLRVRLVAGDSHDGGASGAVDLGRLKGTGAISSTRSPRRAGRRPHARDLVPRVQRAVRQCQAHVGGYDFAAE